MAFCPSCGNPASGNFCTSCGNRLGGDQAPEPESVQDLYPVWNEHPRAADERAAGTGPDGYGPAGQVGYDDGGYGHPGQGTGYQHGTGQHGAGQHGPGQPGPGDPQQGGYETGHETPPPRRGPGLGLGILIGLGVVALVAVGIAVGMNAFGADPVARTSTSATDPTTTSPTASTPTGKDPSTLSADEASTELEALRAQSLAGVDLDGRWVLQLSSKYDGVNDPAQTALDGGHVFHLPDILAEHQQLKTQLQDQDVPVLLLKSSDFGSSTSERRDRTWVTLADPGSMNSKAEAQSRCAALFPGRSGAALDNVCLPRQFNPPS